MTEKSTISRMYLANIIEENDEGFHRESLWFGGTPENLGLMLIDIMKDWYGPHKDELSSDIIRFHEMLEDKENLTFDMLAGSGYNADGMSIYVDLTNDMNDMFGFIIAEICNIFAKEGETPQDFPSITAFREHFIEKYDIDQEFQDVMSGINEATISKALYIIDTKYDYLERHFRN